MKKALTQPPLRAEAEGDANPRGVAIANFDKKDNATTQFTAELDMPLGKPTLGDVAARVARSLGCVIANIDKTKRATEMKGGLRAVEGSGHVDRQDS